MVSKIRKKITVGFHLVMNKETVWIKMNKKTRTVCKTENGNGSYDSIRNDSVWCGVSSDMKISKFKRIIRRDSTLYIEKTFQ